MLINVFCDGEDGDGVGDSLFIFMYIFSGFWYLLGEVLFFGKKVLELDINNFEFIY